MFMHKGDAEHIYAYARPYLCCSEQGCTFNSLKLKRCSPCELGECWQRKGLTGSVFSLISEQCKIWFQSSGKLISEQCKICPSRVFIYVKSPLENYFPIHNIKFCYIFCCCYASNFLFILWTLKKMPKELNISNVKKTPKYLQQLRATICIL